MSSNADLHLLAIGKWIQVGFPSVRRQPSTVADYFDGVIFADVLLSIDPQTFGDSLKPIEPVPPTSPWSMRLSNLKKVWKSIFDYYTSVLGLPDAMVQQASQPNLTAIAKDGDTTETLVFARWLAYLATKSSKASEAIGAVMKLDQKAQTLLMDSIQTMLDVFEGDGSGNSKANDDPSGGNGAATTRPGSSQPTKQQPQPLATNTSDDSAAKLIALKAEKQALESTVKSLTKQTELLRQQQEEATTEAYALKERIKELEAAVEKHSNRAGQSEVVVKTELESLRRQLHESEEKRLENEQFIENQQLLVDDLQRKIEQLSQKAAEADQMRDSLDEFKHVAERLQKSEQMLEKYKKKIDEMADLRKRIKELEEQNLKQATDYAALEDEYRKLGSNRPLVDKYKEQMAQMEARLTDLTADKQRLELELAALRTEHTLAAQQKSRDQEHIAALEEKLHELELQQGVTADGGLQAELTGSATADLKLQISRLQQDNARLKQEQLAAESLRNELEVERAKVVALRRQLTDRDSGERVSSTADAERLASLEAGQKRQLETINRLLVEKDSLQNELLATKDQLLTQERSNADLKQSLALLEVAKDHSAAAANVDNSQLEEKLAGASAKLSEQNEQLRALQQALKKAKDHIINQDQQLKELKSQTAAGKSQSALGDTLEPLQNLLKSRESEIARLKTEMEELRQRTRAEQKLIMSAWYDLGLQLQRRQSSAVNGSPSTPSSWLGQQRRNILDSPIKSRR